MKEYLIKSITGYKYHKTNNNFDGVDVIEIPEGADLATRVESIYFWNTKTRTAFIDGKGWVEPDGISLCTLEDYLDGNESRIIWKRLEKQEELQLVDNESKSHNHYFKDVSGLNEIDVYQVLRLFNVTDPCLQHIVKKALCAGQRGHKDFETDLLNIRDTALRAIEINGGDK